MGSGSVTSNAEERSDRRPNIVLIVADDLGYADLGAHGSTDVRTPHIDELAQHGVLFTNAYVTAPVCAPSRAGMLTGRYQQRFGFEFNPGAIDRDLREGLGLPLDETTIAQLLQAAGYRTAMIGKWHLGADPQYIPNNRGFEHVFGTHGGYQAYIDPKTPGVRTVRGTPYLDRRSPENFVLLNPIWRNGVAICETGYLTDAFTREAARFIDTSHEAPFFLYLPYTAPHTPLQATAELYDAFPSITDENRRVYAAMVLALDAGVGVVVEALARHGLTDNTLVIFTNDNGGALPTNASRNHPLAAGKHYLLEGGIRVPMVIRWPGTVAEGQVFEHPVSTLDLFATIRKAAGVDLPADLVVDGVDLLPYIDGEGSGGPHETLCWRFGDQRAIRHRGWKLFEVGEEITRLHDLEHDPGERVDLASEHPEIVAELRRRYAQWEAHMVAPLWSPNRHPDVADVESVLPGARNRKLKTPN